MDNNTKPKPSLNQSTEGDKKDDNLSAVSNLAAGMDGGPGHAPSPRPSDQAEPTPRPPSSATMRAYTADWRHFTSWCRRVGLPPFPAEPKVIADYLRACAAANVGDSDTGFAEQRLSASTLERRLAGLSWNFAQRGEQLDRNHPHIAEIRTRIRQTQTRAPERKEGVSARDLLAMIETLARDLRGLRDRAILLVGFAGGLRRSEIVGLDCGPDQSEDGLGWAEIFDNGILVRIRKGASWREVEIGRGSSDMSCPVIALQNWLKFGRVIRGPLFRRVFGDNKTVDVERLSDKHVARLVKRTALVAGLRPEIAEGKRGLLFAGQSLRTAIASGVRFEAERERFLVNLTKASGL